MQAWWEDYRDNRGMRYPDPRGSRREIRVHCRRHCGSTARLLAGSSKALQMSRGNAWLCPECLEKAVDAIS